MQLYFPFIERDIKTFYEMLPENEKRIYAAIEAQKIGYGGISYISQIVNCSRTTIYRGISELKYLNNNSNNLIDRIRKPGGGRKPYDIIYPNINEQFLDVLKHYTAGSPMKDVIWTDLSPSDIIEKLKEKHDVTVSKTVVDQLLKKHKYGLRKMLKSDTIKVVEYRNEQFENIAKLIVEYEKTGNPIISMDTKKKEYIGNYYRDGKLYCKEHIRTYDHDFNNNSEGVIIPHSIWDYKLNVGYIHIGTSKDTSQFACDCIRNWWYNHGQFLYPNATSILILCDGGGSNGSRYYIFKLDLQLLAIELGIEIRIAHYPPYTSKYNPIEHRLFPHVTRACQGVVFSSVKIVKELMEKTKTSTGLKVFVKVIDKVYETGRKVDDEFKNNMKIIFDDFLPKWNYRAVPNKKYKVVQLI